MRKVHLLLLALLCTLPLFALIPDQPSAQTKVEICDNRIDDDDDKLVDCDDPDCDCGKKGTPCSPGFWKNHESEFNFWCSQVPGWTCADLWTAINCKGSDASCKRSAAAAALNAVSGCTE